MTAPDLIERHRAARLLHEVCRPAAAAVIAQLPARPGMTAGPDAVREGAGLSIKEFWTTIRRLTSVGVLLRTADGLMLDHDQLDRITDGWVADSPLNPIMIRHPRLAAFVQWGRVTRMPTEPELIEELYEALGDLFRAGEALPEADVNSRVAAVHDDPAEVRRGLVDRGLLLRRPGSGIYRKP